MKNEREIAERMLWERKKIKSKKEKTLQQQKGLHVPTLSVALNKVRFEDNANTSFTSPWMKYRYVHDS